MGETILAQNIYCTKHNPNPDSQFGSLVCKRLGTRAPWSTWEYDLDTVIDIWMLTQPLTREMGSLIFAATGWIKVTSTTWASLPIIPSTERTNRDFFPFDNGSASHARTSFSQSRQKLIHSLCLISHHIRNSKPDINYGLCMALPWSSDLHVILCLWNDPPMTHPPLWSDAALKD